MTKRTVQAYIGALKYVHEKLIELVGQGIIIDFEQAMRTAIKTLFPELAVFGCWFHHCQALRRAVASNKKLFHLIRNNPDAKLLFRQFQCLALLPADRIETAFVWLLRQTLEEHNFSEFAPFLEYYKNQWLLRVKPQSYSVFMRHTRTTAAAEASNGKGNKVFKTHGSFFSFVETLRSQEAVSSDNFERNVNGSKQVDERKPYYKKRSKLIEQYPTLLRDKRINHKQFIRTMANESNDVVFAEKSISVEEIDISNSVETVLMIGEYDESSQKKKMKMM